MRVPGFEQVQSTVKSYGKLEVDWYRPADSHLSCRFECNVEAGKVTDELVEKSGNADHTPELVDSIAERIERVVTAVESTLIDHAEVANDASASYLILHRQGIGRKSSATAGHSKLKIGERRTVKASRLHFHDLNSARRDFIICDGGSGTSIRTGAALRPAERFRDPLDVILLGSLVPFAQKIGRATLADYRVSNGELVEINSNTLHGQPELTLTTYNMAALIGLQRIAT